MRNKSLGYYLQRARELPPQEVVKKALMKPVTIAACKLEKARARLSPAHVSDDQLLESLDGSEDLNDVLNCIRGGRPSFFVEPSVKVDLVALIESELSHLKEETIAEADKVCSHIFDLLGSGDVNLDEFTKKHGGRQACGYLPWHFDFKTGYQWNTKKFHKEIEIPYGKADIKVPWELSRSQHVAPLGQAYWLTRDEKYAEEFVEQVDDWIDRNPPKFGVNWSCTMDVALRVANWICGYYFFKSSKALTDEFLLKFLKSLLEHGRHIIENLENKGVTTNHYLSDLVGLIYLGIAFPDFKEAKRWKEFGIQELVNEMEKQVYDDGMDFEASTCYHRLALELFFYPALLCKLNDIELPDSFMEKLKKMFDFVLYVLKPNGRMPQIGDNDNGRLHVLGKRDILDMTYLLTFATLFFDDPKYKIEGFGFAPEALWLFGSEAYERWSKLPGRSVEGIGSQAFPDGGIYVMRHKKDYMVISCGPNGQNGNGGHAHNDKLSFELCVNGEDIIIDPGTYAYTAAPDWRNKFRSTAYHSTVMIDGEEQNRFRQWTIFSMHQDATVKSLRWNINRESILFEGEHYGYRRLINPVAHRRRIEFNKGQERWKIIDTFSNCGEKDRSHEAIINNKHHCIWSFHVATPVKLCGFSERGVVLKKGDIRINIRLDKPPGSSLFPEVIQSWVSPEYGVRKRNKVIRWKYSGEVPFSLRFIVSRSR